MATLLGEKGIGMSQRQDWIGSYFRRMKDIFQPKYTIGVSAIYEMLTFFFLKKKMKKYNIASLNL